MVADELEIVNDYLRAECRGSGVWYSWERIEADVIQICLGRKKQVNSIWKQDITKVENYLLKKHPTTSTKVYKAVHAFITIRMFLRVVSRQLFLKDLINK